jgi:hypothetical protein
MLGTAANAAPGDTVSHSWKTILPGKAELKQPDACTTCHATPLKAKVISASELQITLAKHQKDIADQIKSMDQQLKSVKSTRPQWDPKASNKSVEQIAYEKARANVDFVKSESNAAIHNYAYAQAVLNKAQEQLNSIIATPTPGPSPTPTSTPMPPPPTPAPSPTPVPPPGGGATWPVWLGYAAVVAIVVGVLFMHTPRTPTAS